MTSSNYIDFDPTQVAEKLVKFFTIVGIWPVESKCRFLYIIYGILFQCTFSYAYTGFELINLFVVTDLSVMTEQIFISVAMVSMCLRMTNFVVHFNEIIGFLEVIKRFKLLNQEECDLYKARLSRFSMVMVFYLSCGTFAVSFSNCAPLFDSKVRLPYPGWYPLDWKSSMTYYWILYAYQFIGIIFLTYTLINLENYQLYCMVSAATQIEIIGLRLKKLGCQPLPSNCKKENTTEIMDLVECIKDHKFLMEFVADVERVFNLPFLFQLFCSSIIFCLTGFQIIVMDYTSDNTVQLAYYLCFSATMLNEIFLPCFFGTELTSKNDEISHALYSSNWPDLSQSFKNTLIIFCEYLKRPRIMMSGKIFTLTLFSFLTVINRSYSLFAVLRNVIK